VALFVPVCRGVQHAHQERVIHRDLKPSNVLVAGQDGAPTPEVIDFGIAKTVDRRRSERRLVTIHGHLTGTPAYMSPEHAEASELDGETRADVDSLGVMLHELLVGGLPIDPADLGLMGFMSQLTTGRTSAPTPAARLDALGPVAAEVAARRRTSYEALRRELRGALEWILMKAMEPGRTRRYETLNALTADLDRYLHHDPVLARPAPAAYRMRSYGEALALLAASGNASTKGRGELERGLAEVRRWAGRAAAR
jgi:non-specific serine/threonine protein kinase/serine/threonine-protein kinase